MALTLSQRRSIFRQLVCEQPDADPVHLAREAGIEDPARFVRDLAEQKAIQKAKAKGAQLSDAERAKMALRRIVSHGNDSQRVNAARALLDASPDQTTADGSGTLVCFYGCEPIPGTIQLQADVTPEEIADAIAYVRTKRATSTENQLETYAIEQGIDVEELGLAWELYSAPDARSAALRVYLMSQSAEPDDVEEPIAI